MLAPEATSLDLTAALAHFAEHGWARLGRLLDDHAATLLAERAEALMLGRISHPGLFFQHDTASGRYEDLAYGKGYEGPSLNYRKIEKLEKDPLFFAWIDNPLFERVARSLIVGDVVIYRAALFGKAARGGTVLPWHQDGGSFWGLDREPTLQIWTALDDAPVEAGCLEIVPGSHRAGLATPLGGLVPAACADARDAERHGVLVPARRGECLLVHNHVWHRSGVNRTDRPRRALSICYMSASTRCLRTRRAPRRFAPVFAGRQDP